MVGKIKRVPNGFHTITPHISLRNATEAIEFYKRAFGAEELGRPMMGPGGKIMHAELKIGDSILFLNDEFPEMGSSSPQTLKGTPATLHLYVDDCDGLFNRASRAGAKVVMPIQDMFWGDRYGMIEDPYGHRWSIGSHIEDVSPEECERRGAEAMKHMCKG